MPPPATKPYQKLPGRGAAGFQVCRLWLGSDHLLLVISSGVGERYKRFYFADIQAFVIRRTAVGFWIWTAIFALPCLGFAALAWASEGGLALAEQGGAGAFFALLLGVHLFRGPTCECSVRTAVQNEALPSLKRLKSARKILAQLRPLIEAAQAPQPAATTP